MLWYHGVTTSIGTVTFGVGSTIGSNITSNLRSGVSKYAGYAVGGVFAGSSGDFTNQALYKGIENVNYNEVLISGTLGGVVAPVSAKVINSLGNIGKRNAFNDKYYENTNEKEYYKSYINNRPSYAKNQVNAVWNKAKNINGKVIDPSGKEIIWDVSKPRSGQWDMGHIPGNKYSEIHELYLNDIISEKEFLTWYRNPLNYRPELPSTNRSHMYE